VAESITEPSARIAPDDPSGRSARPPFWRNVRFVRVVVQVVALVAVLFTLRWLFSNLVTGLDEQGIPTSFDFLDAPAGFSVRDSPFDPDSPVRDLIWVGVRNTAAVSIVGIALALVIGTLVGVGRLSTNWLVRKLATIYVETFRNIPVLVIIIFFGFALFTFGPLPEFNPTNPPNEIRFPGTDANVAIISKSRLGFLSIENGDRSGLFWAIMLVAGLIALLVWLWRTQVNVKTGEPHHRVAYAFVTIIGIGIVAFLILGRPVALSYPEVSESGRVIVGGIATNDGYIALTLALGVYTASHIAEIIRGSILAVPRGQSEAANALALSGFQRYRYVVLPQAMRIALPPIINQFLNLVKNSSLATAVAFPEITALVKTAIGNGNPAPQLVLVLMGCYLVFSLFISLILNIVNRRAQPVGR
jgi:general L-amino acid transport system permease protein